MGFKFRWNDKDKDWAHASAAIILTPEGKISRYLHGVFFTPKDLKMALLEASNGQVGTITDRLIYYCYHYDPTKSGYTIMAMRLVQVGAGLIVLILAAVLIPVWRKSARESKT